MKIPSKILEILNNINHSIKNTDDFLEVKDWQIIDPIIYNRYKNKTKIEAINHINTQLSQKLNDYIIKDTKILFETKDKYGIINYNTNFIAFSFAEREYDIHTKELDLIAIHNKLVYNYQKKITTPPKILNILDVLGWKITKKALQNIKEQLYFIE